MSLQASSALLEGQLAQAAQNAATMQLAAGEPDGAGLDDPLPKLAQKLNAYLLGLVEDTKAHSVVLTQVRFLSTV